MKDGVQAVLSLDEHGQKKTWLLTGWDTKISKDAEREFNATLGATQDGPTFSRSELGALLNDAILDEKSQDINILKQELFDIAAENERLDAENEPYTARTQSISTRLLKKRYSTATATA